MNPILASKAKEIAENVMFFYDNQKETVYKIVAERWLATPEAAAILSGEDWKEDVVEWEYLRAAINNDLQLNAKGKEGWELCVIEKLLGGKDYIFKRPKPLPEPPKP